MPEQNILDVIESFGDLPFVLLADFNARTGNENSDVAGIDDCCFDIFANNEDQCRPSYRVSKANVHDFGKVLSECGVRTESDLTILNGSADGSNIGKYTCFPNGLECCLLYCCLKKFDSFVPLFECWSKN